MGTGRQELDFQVLITREHILNGVRGKKNACGLQRGLAPVVGESVTVGLDESALSDPIPWAAWESIEPSTARTRTYSGDLTPGDIARKVITVNDTGDRRRLAAQWPEGGVLFTVRNVISRYKQTAKKGQSATRRPAEAADNATKARRTRGPDRKPRRTMRRYATTT